MTTEMGTVTTTTPATCNCCAGRDTAARPSQKSEASNGTASVLTTEDAALMGGLEQEPTQLDRIESMLVWLCEAMAGEEEDEAGQVAASLSEPSMRPVERRASL